MAQTINKYIMVTNLGSNTVGVSTMPLVVTSPALAAGSFNSFASRQDLSLTGSRPFGQVLRDLDGDGQADLVTVTSGEINVLKNTSLPNATTLTFAAQASLTDSNSLDMIIAEDFDGDGKLDLSIGDFRTGTSGYIVVYRNISTGGTINFATASATLTTSASIWSVCRRFRL